MPARAPAPATVRLPAVLLAALLLAPTLLVAGCARADDAVPDGPPQVEYSALGQEPGWALRIDRERIVYTGDYGDTRIAVARPLAVATPTGSRFATARLTVDIAPGRCNDVMSGRGFEDNVIVTAGGRTVRGCGGARVVEFDM
jgi:uncharacterized membrane protein